MSPWLFSLYIDEMVREVMLQILKLIDRDDNAWQLKVDQFKYLCSVIAGVCHRVNERYKVLGAMKGVMKNRGLGMNVKTVLWVPQSCLKVQWLGRNRCPIS